MRLCHSLREKKAFCPPAKRLKAHLPFKGIWSHSVEARIAADPAAVGFHADGVPLPALTLIAVEEPENNLAPFYLSRRADSLLTGKVTAQSVSCRTIPYKMKQAINSRRTGNLLSRAGNLLRLAGFLDWVRSRLRPHRPGTAPAGRRACAIDQAFAAKKRQRDKAHLS